MKPYSRTHPEEKETYSEYKERKEQGWRKGFFIELKDSSLKQEDKERFLLQLLKEIL